MGINRRDVETGETRKVLQPRIFATVDVDVAVVQDSRQDNNIPQVPKHWKNFRHMGDVVSMPVRSDPTPGPGATIACVHCCWFRSCM